MQTITISIVIPCYNEEAGFDKLLERTGRAARDVVGEAYEIIFIDDGSSDGTWHKIAAASSVDQHVVGIKLSRNHGHQLALTAGLNYVRGAEIFVIDADLQDPPELLGDMRKLMHESSSDVVYGVRRTRQGEGWFKLWSANMFYRLLAAATEVDIPLDTGDFRLMSRRMADLLSSMPERDRFIRGMVAWLGYKQTPFHYDRNERFAGATKYPLKKMIRLALDAFVGFSSVPTRMASYLATISFISLFFIAGYAIFGGLYWGAVPGWTSLALLILFLSGVQLTILGIISEFVGRTYLQLKQRPLFLVDQVLRSDVS